MNMSSTLIVVMVLLVYAYAQTQQDVCIKYMQFFILYLNKA